MDPTRSRPSFGQRIAASPLWLLYACTVLIIFVLTVAEAVLVLDMRESTLRNTEASLRNISIALAEHANRALQGLDLVLASTLDAVAAEGVTDSASLRAEMSGFEAHRLLGARLTGLPYIRAVSLIDASGDLVNVSRFWPVPLLNVTDRDYFQEMRSSPSLRSFVSAPVQSRIDGGWAVYLGRRIPAADGAFAGLVLGAVELQYFEDLYRSMLLSVPSTIALLRDDNMLLARYPHLDAIGRIMPSPPQQAAGFALGNGVTRGISLIDGDMRLKAIHRLGNFPINVLVTTSQAAALAEWRQMVLVLVLITAGCAASVLVAALAIGRRWRQDQALARVRTDRAEAEQARAVAEAGLARERERHAEEASRAKSGFLAMMSHEIRTPMNAVLGLAGTLLDSPLPQQQRTIISAIRDSGDSLLRLLNDILDFSKLDAGRMTLENAAFSPDVVTHSTVSILGPRATAKGLSITAACDPVVPRALLGDAGRIRQVLLNLVSNAVKFTEAGSVSIHAGCPARTATHATIEWTVHDTGIGIPEAAIDSLFGEFMQADSSITRRFGGTGLGLAISKRLLDQMGGTVSVASTPGAGTTFRVCLTLPIADDMPVAKASLRNDVLQAFTECLQALGRPLRVLFAEDNPTNQLVALQLLKGFNVQVDVVADGLEAIDAASSFLYDVICMDVRMPEMDGLAATRLIRKRGGRLASVPIVALTANAFPEDIKECFDAGMNQFVAKPVNKEVLLNAILEALTDRAPQPHTADPDEPGTPVARHSGDEPSAAAATPREAVASPQTLLAAAPGCEAKALAALAEDIGADGVAEMLALFEAETRARFARLAAGAPDAPTLLREIHTLKGAAGTVCAARLACHAAIIEQRLHDGGALVAADLPALATDFEAWLEAVHSKAWLATHAA